jgi:acetyl esterase/lipase
MTSARPGVAVRVLAVRVLTAMAVLVVAALASTQPAGANGGSSGTLVRNSDIDVTHGIVYARVGGVILTLNTYRAAHAAPDRPALVLIHGGAWGVGKAEDLDPEGRLVAREGWVGFSVNYRLANQTPRPWPDELTDVQRAVRWVGANAAKYGVDPTRIALLGISAGGHLGILAGEIGTAVDGTGHPFSDSDPPVDIRAVAAWSPPTRLSGLVTPLEGSKPPDCGDDSSCTTFWRLPLVTNFMKCHPETCPDKYLQASPTSRASSSTVPIWWSNSTDELVPLVQAEALDKSLDAAKVDHLLDVVPGGGHGDVTESKVWNGMMAWLASKLGVPTPPTVNFSGQTILLLSPIVIVSVVIGLALLIILLAAVLRDDEGAI